MSEIHISVAAIAQLTACSPQAVHKALKRGRYGVPVQRGRNVYVPLANVEARLGQPITSEQLARATAGNPARVLTVATPPRRTNARSPEESRHPGRTRSSPNSPTPTARIEAIARQARGRIARRRYQALDAIELTMSRLAEGRRAPARTPPNFCKSRSRTTRPPPLPSAGRHCATASPRSWRRPMPAAVELQETVARAVALFRKIIDIRETARAAWPISRRTP